MLDLGDGRIVKAACTFLAVAAYERDGVSLFEHKGAILNLPGLHLHLLRDMVHINVFHYALDISLSSSRYAVRMRERETNPLYLFSESTTGSLQAPVLSNLAITLSIFSSIFT